MKERAWFKQKYFEKPISDEDLGDLNFVFKNDDGKFELDCKNVSRLIRMGAKIATVEEAMKMATWQADCPHSDVMLKTFMTMQRNFLLKSDEEIADAKRISDEVIDAIPLIRIMKEQQKGLSDDEILILMQKFHEEEND